VGNTRFSWVGMGDDFQRAFFHRLASTRHLGLLHDSRMTVLGTTGYAGNYECWTMFAMNLTGDPEMQVYREALPRLVIRLDRDAARVLVTRFPVPQLIPTSPCRTDVAPNTHVHISAGLGEYDADTDETGQVALPDGLAEAPDLVITASAPNSLTARLVVY
jgi:hypothetical protein